MTNSNINHLFNRLGNSLDFESGNHNEIPSIPSPWSRALQFISAMRNNKYPSREWLIAQYRGFLAAIAFYLRNKSQFSYF